MTDDNRKLPGLNFDAGLGSDDFEYLQEVIANEFRTRTKLATGSYLSQHSYGIVSSVDPTTVTDLVTAPLLVERNTGNPEQFDVSPGYAVTPAGDFVYLATDQLALDPTDTLLANDQFVVYLEYEVEPDADTVKLNRFNTAVARQRKRLDDDTKVRVARISEWNDATVFTPARKTHIVVIAHLLAVSDDTGLRLEVSLDNSILAENRPWFSMVDIEHRSLRGTGSDDVPHSLSLSDLSSGNLTLYSQTLNHGMVISRDSQVPGVPGKICSEVLDIVRERIDTNGSVTGTIGIKYFELQRFPVRLLGISAINDPTREIAASLLPYTNIVVIHGDESVGAAGSTVYYTTASAGEPETRADVNDEITFRQPDPDQELAISGGLGYTEIQPAFTNSLGESRARISIGDAGPIPKKFQILLDADGQLTVTPSLLLCATELDDLGTAAFSIEKTQIGDSKIRLGLTNTPVLGSMNLVVQVTGTGPNGAVTEDLTFTSSNYDPATLGDCREQAGNFVVSESTFSSVSSIQVITKTSIDPGAILIMYADVNPIITEELQDACPLAEVTWNGQSVCRIRDVRAVGSKLDATTRTNIGKVAAQAILASTTTRLDSVGMEIASDDFRDPRCISITQGIQFEKLSDGLRSTTLPNDPILESVETSEEALIYTQAFVLPDRSNRRLQVMLLGNDADSFQVQPNDNVAPTVEYRIGQKNSDPWGSWTQMPKAIQANGQVYILDIPDGYTANFKIQFRFKGQLAGYAALLRPDIALTDVANNYTKAQVVSTYAYGDVSGTIAIDANNSNTFSMTLTGATTLELPTNMQDGGSYIFRVKQDGTGSHTLSFEAGWEIATALSPYVASAGADEEDVLSVISDGSTMKIVGIAQNIVAV